jgi:hypothetical protein
VTKSPSGRVAELLAQIDVEQPVKGGAFALIRALDSARNDPAHQTTGERDRYISALAAIAEFLSACGTNDLGKWIGELGSALSDLNTGTVRSFLQPAKIHSKSADPSHLWRGRAIVAAAVDLLVQSGLTRELTAKKIEKEFSGLTALVNPKKKLGASALSWRDELAKGRVSNVEAIRLYAELEKKSLAIIDIDSTKSLIAAEWLLRSALGEIPKRT